MDIYLRHLVYSYLPLDYRPQDPVFGISQQRERKSSSDEDKDDDNDDLPTFEESESPEEKALKRQLFMMLRAEAN